MPEHTAQPAAPPPVTNLDQPQWYLNRELTWLAFNRRVLHEAQDDRVPLLERVFFLAVHAGNLDEFFMKRIGGLKQQVGAGVRELSVDGLQLSAMLLAVRVPTASPPGTLGAVVSPPAALTVMVMVGVLVVALLLSVTVNGMLTVPLKSAAGLKIRPAASLGLSGVFAVTGVVPSGR